MERVVDLLLVLFEFEKSWFARRVPSLKIQWVGHPLIDRWRYVEEPPDDGREPRIALLPGSRIGEIETHLPIMLHAAYLLRRSGRDFNFVVMAANEEVRLRMREMIRRLTLPGLAVDVQSGCPPAELNRCCFALVASGTATLECALAGVPMAVIYKVHPITYALGKRLVQTRWLSMVNILADNTVVPEFLQDETRPGAIFSFCAAVLDDPALLSRMRSQLRKVAQALGPPGASERAAEAIQSLLG